MAGSVCQEPKINWLPWAIQAKIHSCSNTGRTKKNGTDKSGGKLQKIAGFTPRYPPKSDKENVCALALVRGKLPMKE